MNCILLAIYTFRITVGLSLQLCLHKILFAVTKLKSCLLATIRHITSDLLFYWRGWNAGLYLPDFIQIISKEEINYVNRSFHWDIAAGFYVSQDVTLFFLFTDFRKIVFASDLKIKHSKIINAGTSIAVFLIILAY